MELRPLGFGEIFDRAITLYLKNFKPLFTIVLVVYVPYAFAQYWLTLRQSRQFDAMFWIFAHPGKAPPPALLTPQSPATLFAVLAVLVAFYALWIVAFAAVSVGIARVYRGRDIDFVACYRAALSRWPAMLGVLACELLLLAAWYAMVIVVAVVTLLFATLVAKASIIAGFVAFTVAIVVSLAAIATVLPVFVAMTCAMYAVPIERAGPVGAIAAGFSRVFVRGEFWRATLFALAGVAATFAASAMVGVVSMTLIFLHWIVPAVLLSTVLNAAISPFSIVLLAVYYFDVRIRREGYDLEAELERVAAAPA